VLVRGYVHEVTIACAGEVIARHPRSYEREAVIYDPLHYLALLEQKTRALDQAAPLAGWQLPECFASLRRTEVLGSERLTGALLDRLTHHVHILEMNGDSFRLKHRAGENAAPSTPDPPRPRPIPPPGVCRLPLRSRRHRSPTIQHLQLNLSGLLLLRPSDSLLLRP
jgi:hypothetical protein